MNASSSLQEQTDPSIGSESGKPSPAEQKIAIKLDRPISELTWIQKSLVFAELSRLAYADPEPVERNAYEAGLDQCVFVARDGAEAFVLGNRFDCLIICRGTEPNQWNDIRADANAWTVATEVGRVHSGFNSEVNELWPLLEQQIKANQRTLWFAGHSLGGAMAAVCAVRCKISPIPSNPTAIFSYGAPRVGNRPYTSVLKVKHYRWVNNNDIVPRVPPRWLGYRHMGQEIYLNRHGKISYLRSWMRVRDRFRGLLSALRVGKLDYFSDHSMIEYLGHIRKLYKDELAGNPVKTPRHIPAD
ncbi:MAG: lipase family protein [Pirellula sp.]